MPSEAAATATVVAVAAASPAGCGPVRKDWPTPFFMMQSFLMHWVSTYTPRDDSPPVQSCVAQSLSDAELCDTKPCVLRAPTSLPQPQHPTDSPFWSRFSLFSSPFSPLQSLFCLFVDQNGENNAENGESPLMAACIERAATHHVCRYSAHPY